MLVCFCLVNSPAAGAEEGTQGAWSGEDSGLSPEEEFLFMDESLVVSAVKYQQPLSQAPSTIHVITAEEIRRSGLTDIGEILRRVPGLDVIMITASQVEVSARGFNQTLSNKMLVMIDVIIP